MALASTVRDRMLDRYIKTVEAIGGASSSSKVVAYLSAEFLTGPHLGNSLVNLGIWQAAQEAVSRHRQDLSDLLEQEEEPGLGNGGLGRLAACYMDSLATLNVPAIGYGIRYEFGIFDQAIRDGWQVELTDKWLRFGEVERLKASGYRPRGIYESNPELRQAIDLIDSGFFSNGDRELFRPLVESLLVRDDYVLLADYQAYVDCQRRVSDAYGDPKSWVRMSILNSARVGRFSSDRSIRDYCRDIWNVSPLPTGEGSPQPGASGERLAFAKLRRVRRSPKGGGGSESRSRRPQRACRAEDSRPSEERGRH
jgi:glucan phosphorylase